MKEEQMWICVIIRHGKVDLQDLYTISYTRTESYKKLSSNTSYTLDQLKKFGWKCIKITVSYQV